MLQLRQGVNINRQFLGITFLLLLGHFTDLNSKNLLNHVQDLPMRLVEPLSELLNPRSHCLFELQSDSLGVKRTGSSRRLYVCAESRPVLQALALLRFKSLLQLVLLKVLQRAQLRTQLSDLLHQFILRGRGQLLEL